MNIVLETGSDASRAEGAIESLLKGLVFADLSPIAPHFLHAQYADISITYLSKEPLIAFRVLKRFI
jgi:hypothetical protein